MFTTDKLQRFFLALLFFGFTFFAFRRGLAGQTLWLQLGVIVIFGGFAVFTLKEHYWLLIPLSMLANISVFSIFGRSVQVIEIAIFSATLVFLTRTALLQTSFHLNPRVSWPVHVHLLWVAAIFLTNPTGMAVLGSDQIGGRFYISILLGGLAFTILSLQKCSEKEAKWIVWGGIALSFLLPLQRILQNLGLHIFWHQAWSWPSSLLVFFLLTRYRHWTVRFILVYLFAVAIAMMSGKRAALGVILVLPFISTWILHRQPALAMARLTLIIIPLGLVLVTHGTFYELPFSAQRAMAIFPGNWDVRLEDMNEDVFRQEMRKLAFQEIRERPILGRRGFSFQREQMAYGLLASPTRGDIFTGHAESANWHSTWIAFWVDFGLPAVLLYLAFSIICLAYGLKTYRLLPDKSYRKILAGMLLLWFISHMIRSYTGGHSALIPLKRWWILAMFIALQEGFKANRRKQVAGSENPALEQSTSVLPKED